MVFINAPKRFSMEITTDCMDKSSNQNLTEVNPLINLRILKVHSAEKRLTFTQTWTFH